MAEAKRVAIVANTTWNIYNFRLNIIRMLREAGHEVFVIAPIDKYISYQERFRDVTHIPIRKLKRDSVNPLRDMQLTLELIRIYRTVQPDIIIHYTVKPNIYGGFAARMAGIPSIAVVTGLGYAFIHNGIVKRTTKTLYKWSSQFHRKVIFENHDDLELFISLGLLERKKGASVMGCGVDTELFKPTVGVNNEKSEVIFTFIGRLLYDKGIREFIHAAKSVIKENPQARFWIIGELDADNPSSIKESDFIQWARDEEISYLGPKDDVRPFMEGSDCIVLPSYREGMSRVIMEAMSMERPVITTDTAGCREAVDDGVNGFLVPVADVPALARAMTDFIALDPVQREAMGKAGREKAIRQFDEDLVADFYHNLIDEVLESQESV